MSEGKRPRRRLLPPRYDQVTDYLTAVACEVMVAHNEALRHLRRRKDGQPSAAPPKATLAIDHLATVEEPPDGGEDGDVSVRLEGYRAWLLALQRNGIYDGPTTLTVVNPPAEPTGGATSAASPAPDD